MQNPRRDYRFSLHEEFFLKFIDPTKTQGLEIGAFDIPFVEPGKGNCDYADFRTCDELKALALKFDNIDKNYIVRPSYDLRNGYDQIRKEYDWICASHVMEHVPDLLGWLKILQAKLKPNGILFLVVPDKQYTFDFHRSETRFSDVMYYHRNGITKPAYRQVFDHIYYASTVPSPAEIWNGVSIPPPAKNLTEALSEAERSLSEYVDVHCSVHTPVTFSKLAFEMFEADVVKLQLHALRPTQYGQMDFSAMIRKVL